ncbi:DUF3093 domain-containing protein [Kineococcus glutinatus]|uniref:DUF3093 domain-containing protein n=1 Tax=Kineococcus glutinatus TaxID=1070872 RepID=A0ABP9HVL5_9ACTN
MPAGGDAPTGPGGADTAHAERLWPSAGAWTACCAIAFTAGLVPLPVFGPRAAVVVAVLAVLVVAAALAVTSTPVRVEGGQLVAGRSRIPLEALGPAQALDRAALRRALGTELDARAHLVTRGWVPTGVRVPVVDEEDPTPYWVVSTRRPEALVRALQGR